jgi:hypothetical protein
MTWHEIFLMFGVDVVVVEGGKEVENLCENVKIYRKKRTFFHHMPNMLSFLVFILLNKKKRKEGKRRKKV